MKPKELVNMMYSPQWTGKLLHHFLSGVQSVTNEGIKTELIYLVLPFLSDNIIKEKLCKANKNSSLKTVFKDDNTLTMKNSLLKKDQQLKDFIEITNNSIIYLGNYATLNLGFTITINETVIFQNEDPEIREYCKAAYYLGVVLSKEHYINTIHKLGITTL